jgi:hypothetical protein
MLKTLVCHQKGRLVLQVKILLNNANVLFRSHGMPGCLIQIFRKNGAFLRPEEGPFWLEEARIFKHLRMHVEKSGVPSEMSFSFAS